MRLGAGWVPILGETVRPLYRSTSPAMSSAARQEPKRRSNVYGDARHGPEPLGCKRAPLWDQGCYPAQLLDQLGVGAPNPLRPRTTAQS